MASELTIVAIITADPERADDVRASLEGLVEPTRAEEGCVLYDLHVDNDQPGRFLFYETWTTRELWQHHMQSDHIKAHQERTAGAVAEFTLLEMSKIA